MSRSFDHIERFYFVGVGGIGMSALARWFLRQGKAVSGYDRTETPLTRQLAAEGVAITYEDSVATLPEDFSLYKEENLVVYTPAIPKGHRQMAALRETGYEPVKRSEVLGRLSEAYYTIAVGGTHGKTSTSAMLAHMLCEAGVPTLAFVGGLVKGYESNLITNITDGSDPEVLVVEADEYDRSFLRLSPDVALITAVEADHLDIYGEYDRLRESFAEFAAKASLALVAEGVDLPILDRPVFSYGYAEGQAHAESVSVESGRMRFAYRYGDGYEPGFALRMPGRHNVENAVGAVLAVQAFDKGERIPLANLAEGLSSFQGIKRRFEYIHEGERVTYIDDYAHHPTEIRAFVDGARAMHPGRKLTVVFQPHLFSRTRDFAEGFAESLDLADEVVLLDVYPAREEPMPGVTSALIYEKMKSANKSLVSDGELLETLGGKELDVLATVGAGNIDRFVPQIGQWLASFDPPGRVGEGLAGEGPTSTDRSNS